MLCLKKIYWRWGLPFPRNCSHAWKMPKWDGIVPYRTLSQSAHTQKNVAQYFHYVSHPGPLCCQGQLLFCCLGPAIRLLPAQYQPSTFFFSEFTICVVEMWSQGMLAHFYSSQSCNVSVRLNDIKTRILLNALLNAYDNTLRQKKTFVPWTVVFRWK